MSTTFTEHSVPLRERVAGEVRAFMARHGLTQSRLAEALHWRQQYLSRRLTGSVPFDVEDLAQIAEVFGIQPEDLLRGPANPGKRPEVRRLPFRGARNYKSVITGLRFAKYSGKHYYPRVIALSAS